MITRDMRDQFRAMLRPVRNRVDNMVARGVVTLVNSAVKMQLIQVGIQEGETKNDVEHFQPFGFHGVPKVGAESVLLFIGGDRNTPVAVVTDDRRYRPTDWVEDEAGLFNAAGAMVRLKANGDVEVTPGGSGKVYVRSSGGSSDALVTKTEHNSHIHGTGVGPSATPTTPATGTTKLEAE